jgi:hypothetical protein
MSAAHAIAVALGRPRSAGRNRWRCLCPLHGGHSLELADGDSALLVKCWGGCDTSDVLVELREHGLLDENRQAHRVDRDDHRRDDDRDGATRTVRALMLWREAVPIAGTLAERYLASRGIVELPTDVVEVLRFHRHCIFGQEADGAWIHHPCMLALVRDVISNEPVAIYRTALRPDATKIDRMACGPTRGGAVKLWPDDAVTTGLVVGEGVETVLFAASMIYKNTLLRPAWALGDAHHLRDFPVLAGVEALTILVDRDANNVGQAAARACAQRWDEVGREVIRLIPR